MQKFGSGRVHLHLAERFLEQSLGSLAQPKSHIDASLPNNPARYYHHPQQLNILLTLQLVSQLRCVEIIIELTRLRRWSDEVILSVSLLNLTNSCRSTTVVGAMLIP